VTNVEDAATRRSAPCTISICGWLSPSTIDSSRARGELVDHGIGALVRESLVQLGPVNTARVPSPVIR
jgi:hypothetical protein